MYYLVVTPTKYYEEEKILRFKSEDVKLLAAIIETNPTAVYTLSNDAEYMDADECPDEWNLVTPECNEAKN